MAMVWLTVLDVAREYDRDESLIRKWCVSGFILELGYSLRRDFTGHWEIGVPPELYRNFGQSRRE